MTPRPDSNTVGARMLLEDAIGNLLEANPNVVHITSDGNDYVNKCRNQRFDVGIAESNLINVATGFALKNHKPIVNGIASFVLYNAYLQIRNNISHHSLPIVMIGVGTGLSYGHLGATHHALEDIACLYTLPNMAIYLPADGLEAVAMLERAVALGDPAYIRTRNGQEPIISTCNEYRETSSYDTPVLIGDSHPDVLIMCYGATIAHSLRAADILRQQDVSVGVLCLRTLSSASINNVISLTKTAKHIVVVEEHYSDSGVGSIVGSRVNKCAIMIGVEKAAKYVGGTPDELFIRYGIDADGIVKRIRETCLKEKL